MEYNGWKNRATWNVALWIGNDEALYRTAVDYVNSTTDRRRVSWRGFVAYAGLDMARTPDRYAYNGAQLDRRALTDMLRELAA
jgi:hypothetical protein